MGCKTHLKLLLDNISPMEIFMETFYAVFGPVIALCAGIIILTLFFTAIGYFKRVTRGFNVIKMKGFIKNDKLINVHLRNGKILTEVCFVGFTDQSSTNTAIPHQLSKMVVLETVKGVRMYIKSDSVQMFEEVENVTPTSK